MKKYETVYNIDNLTIFKTEGEIFSEDSKDTAPRYYWKHVDTLRFEGPFHTTQLALEHYRGFTKPPPLPALVSISYTNNVIEVDFKNKRRIS